MSISANLRAEGKLGQGACIVIHYHGKGADAYVCLTESDRIELATRIIGDPETWQNRGESLDFSWAPVYNPTTQTSQWEDYND